MGQKSEAFMYSQLQIKQCVCNELEVLSGG